MRTPLLQPDIRPVGDRLYELQGDYVYEWDVGGVANRMRVPAGFRYDGASVPRLFWTASGLHPDGLIRAAALLHDWLYQHGGLLPVGSHETRDESGAWRAVRGRWTRRDADRLFARMMREAGVGRRRRRASYLFSRAFGACAWKD